MSKTKWIIIGVVTLFLLIVFAMPNESEPTVSEPTVSETDVFKESFMEGCLENSSENNAYCNCAYDELSDNYSRNELIRLSEDIESEETQDALFDAVLACQDHLR